VRRVLTGDGSGTGSGRWKRQRLRRFGTDDDGVARSSVVRTAQRCSNGANKRGGEGEDKAGAV
jgi:hypothetical protein